MRSWRQFKKNMPLLSLSMPGLAFKFIFSYLPLIGLVLAFKRYRYDLGIIGSEWVGFRNFEFFFKSNSAWLVTRNTVLYNAAFIGLTLVLALLLAVMLNELSGRWVKVHQSILFFPYFLSWVVVGYVVLGLLDHRNGFINQVLPQYGMNPVKWFQEEGYWPFILCIVHLWKSLGFSTLIYYAGIIGIDPSYYEAARIDGASRWQMVRRITLPLLTPLIVILLIVDLGKIFRADFGLFYFIPNDSSFLYNTTDVIDTYVYRSLRVLGDIGMSTAIGLYQSVVGFALVVATNYIVRLVNRENSLW